MKGNVLPVRIVMRYEHEISIGLARTPARVNVTGTYRNIKFDNFPPIIQLRRRRTANAKRTFLRLGLQMQNFRPDLRGDKIPPSSNSRLIK